MLSPIAAWIALRGEVAWPPVWLGLAVFFWVGGFDIIYACQDVEFDRERGLFSLPARIGVSRALKLAMVSHALMLVCLAALWVSAGLGPVFLAGIVGVAVLLAYEHSLVKPNDLGRVNLAFFHVNAVVSVGLLLLGLADLWWSGRTAVVPAPAAAVRVELPEFELLAGTGTAARGERRDFESNLTPPRSGECAARRPGV